jgi:hypothetical protein
MFFIGVKHHPDAPKRPLIDYEVSTFMQAGELLGVTIGVICNVLLSDLWILIFLFVILMYNGWRTLKKGSQKYKQETAAFASESQRNTLSKRAEDTAVKQDCSSCFPASSSADALATVAQTNIDLFLENLRLNQYSEKLHLKGVNTLFDLDGTDDVVLEGLGMSTLEVQKLRKAFHYFRLETALTVAPRFDAGVLEALSPRAIPAPSSSIEASSVSPELQQLYKDTEVKWPFWAYSLS